MPDFDILLTLALFPLFLAGLWLDLRGRRRGTFPFLSFATGYYFFFHGVFSVHAARQVPHLPYAGGVEPAAAAFICAFVALLLAGYALSFRAVPRCVAGAAPAERADGTGLLIFVAAAGMSLVFLFHLFPAMHALPSLPQLRQPVWLFAVGSLSFLLLRRRLTPAQTIVFLLAVTGKIVLDLRNGQITPIVFNGMVFLAAAFYLRRYRLAGLCIVLCAATVASYGYVKYFSRTVVSSGATNIFQFTPEASLQSVLASVNAMARRSSHALLTSHVMAHTPGAVPFDRDRNPFLDSVVNHIPRAVWRDKPKEDKGNAFGKAYGIVNEDDERTSWNLAWTVDFYITAGARLALLDIFLVGAALGLAVRLLSRHPDRAFGFGLYSATVFPLFYQESNFSLMAGSLLWSAAFLLFAYGLAGYLFRRIGRAATYTAG
ncbi:MAG: hypothetical protein WD470_07255 [Rhodospirillaceae bacterium]